MGYHEDLSLELLILFMINRFLCCTESVELQHFIYDNPFPIVNVTNTSYEQFHLAWTLEILQESP